MVVYLSVGMGFERNRIVNLDDNLAKHLKCSICLNIFDNAVNNKCGHTFCKQCVHKWIQNNHKECPECREPFTPKRTAPNGRVDNAIIIISNNVFMPNLTANGIVSEMRIKCDFEFNGCKEVVEVGLLVAHLKKCQFTLCKTCGFTAGRDGEHNCLELMRSARDELKNKLIQYEQANKEWRDKCAKVEAELVRLGGKVPSVSGHEKDAKNKDPKSEAKAKEAEERVSETEKNEWKIKFKKFEQTFNELKDKYNKIEDDYNKNEDIIQRFSHQLESIILDTNYVQFGADLIYSYKFNVNSNEFKLFITPSDCLIAIRFEEILELMYCSDPLLPVLIMKPRVESLNQLRTRINTKDPTINWFNANVNGE